VRHGKHLFVKLSKNGWLRMHFGMTGFLRYFKNRSQQPEHVRLRLDFSNGYCLAYDNLRLLGQIGWVSEPDKFVKDENLGPDALKGLDLKKFRKLLSGRRGSIKSALMDQNAIAGIGNIYSDEILFQAKIHPGTSAKNLLKNRLKKVYEALQQVLQVAIECRADPEKFPDHFLIPRREEGKACPRCAGRVEKITISGRSGYLCPDCQKSPDS
jgi:formamidopyrimidine-DNA glycosylase